jgi:hypothetical protein
MTVLEYNEFISKIEDILKKINNMYSKNQLNFFYDYNALLNKCTQITITASAAPALATPADPITIKSSLLEYLRDKYIIKDFIRGLIKFLFDFCTDKEEHLIKIREIIRTKLNLQITDKDIDKLFNEEFKKQLQGNFGKHYGNRPHNPTENIKKLQEYKNSISSIKSQNELQIDVTVKKMNDATRIYKEYGILNNSNSNELEKIKKNRINMENKKSLSLLNRMKYKTPDNKKVKLKEKVKQISYGFKRKFLERPYVLYKNTPSIIA